MPNYYIDIIDTADNTHTTVLENAARSSVNLSYRGSDAKDELTIVGSTLKFTIVVSTADNVDGALDHMLTGDEQRYKVEMRKESDDTLIWQGFILPDDYSEPWKQGTLSISFTSTDGLGRIKGKYLPDSFYEEENTVTSILAECLKLTGLSMPFYFCPSIENYHQDAYHTIYIKGTDFVSNNKKDDAYKILQYFAEDLLFCVFQSMGYWHLEGLNKRNLLTYSAKEYDVDGAFVANVDLTRNIKDINTQSIATPEVTAVVPYGIVTIDHERKPVEFLQAQSNEINDGWAVTTGVNPEIYSTEWIGTFYAKAVAPDYNIILYNSNTNIFNQNRYVGLRSKLYLQRSEKYKLEFEISINDTDYNQELSVVSSWNNPLFYKITFNGATLYSNFDGPTSDEELLNLVNTKSKKLSFEFVVPENGLLDVIFYEPYITDEEIVSVQINSLEIEPIGFIDTETFTDVVSEDYTNVLSKSLNFADDPSGFSKSFRLQKLSGNATPVVYNTITVPILYSFTQNGKYYSVVQLDGANLIKENITNVVHQSVGSVDVLDVVYNYQNNEQMVVETTEEDLTGNFLVNIYYRNQGPQNRYQWLEWSDSLYGVEKLRFADVHAKIYRRLFKVPHVKVDLGIKMPVLFNDMIRWNYKEPGNYTISSIRRWDIDNGKVELTINRAVYQNDDGGGTGENLPPFVEAGNTIYISDSATTAQLTSESGDPDGFVVSWQWSQLTAVAGVNFATPNAENTLISNLTGDFYTFQIQVTDNDGATATDTVNVVRLKDYLITFTEIYNDVNTGIADVGNETEKHYRLDCTPALPNDFNLTIGAQYEVDLDVDEPTFTDNISNARLIVDKNGAEIVNDYYDVYDLEESSVDAVVNIPFNYNNTDTIIIKLKARASFDNPEGVYARAELDFNVNAITFASGQGNITSVLPINKEVLILAN
jgi:hypothetical protein